MLVADAITGIRGSGSAPGKQSSEAHDPTLKSKKSCLDKGVHPNDSLQKLFREDRGNYYFVGEVFAVDSGLIPNSQRDYFNENPERAVLERELRRYFNDELQRIYYTGSAINSGFKKIDSYERKCAEFENHEKMRIFSDPAEREQRQKDIGLSKREADAARHKIEKAKQKSEGVIRKVIQHVEAERSKKACLVQLPATDLVIRDTEKRGAEDHTQVRANLTERERVLISRIVDIIKATADSQTAEKIIQRIEANFR